MESVKQEFDVVITRSQCQAYDPTKYQGRNLSPKFKELFEKTRKDFDAGLVDIPIANKYYRLRQYQKFLERTRNLKTGMNILKQAAQDIGGQFTNRQEITGKDGGPVETVQSAITKEEFLKARREVLDEY